MTISGDTLTSMRFFYLITAITLLALAIVVYPTLRERSKEKK